MPLVASVESPPNNGNWALSLKFDSDLLALAPPSPSRERAPCLGRMALSGPRTKPGLTFEPARRAWRWARARLQSLQAPRLPARRRASFPH